jgi:small subunit ribosomal protein S9
MKTEEKEAVLEEEEKAEEKAPEIDEILMQESEEKKEATSIPIIEKGKYIEGIGRRKTSVARVRIWQREKISDDFEIIVNGRDYREYFPGLELSKVVDSPLRKLKIKDYKVTVLVKGGGIRGQAEAIRLGLARALVKLNPEWRVKFKKAGYLTRDARVVERKKYGRRKARRREQWQKR